MTRFTKILLSTTMLVAAAGMVSTSAFATDGMFSNGTGARNKALAGAGVADQNDATATIVNPAGLVNSDTQLNIAASVFSPHRKYEIMTQAGAYGDTSDSNYFVIPNVSYSYKIDSTSALGISLYGNGGMNTDYQSGNFTLGMGDVGQGADLGQNLMQMIMSVAYAKRYGSLSVGIAPTIGFQMFTADGVPAMGPAGFAGPGSEETDVAAGIALRGGLQWDVADNFRVGVAGSTPGWSQAFTHYDGPGELFGISEGELRMPAYVQAGLAFDLMPQLTLMADYKRIFYSDSKAIGTAAAEGGFGWSDIDIYKIGAEWDLNPGFTLRAGYSYNTSPLSTEAAAFFQNILAPATSKHHITGGAKMKMTDSVDFELAGMYTPNEKVSTPGSLTAAPSTVEMYQWEATAGVVWHLGNAEAPVR